ncbi:MAG: ribbon-helix-helix protein, CopG family [Dehalococcoidia bacterium]|nr:ribbon-helix-helix protein, CopG family [Dehalococcoidia bacterium]
MGKAKLAVTIDERTVHELDRLVDERVFSSRSQAIEEAVKEKLVRLRHTRLARETAKLDPSLEQAMAEEGMAVDVQAWPPY